MIRRTVAGICAAGFCETIVVAGAEHSAVAASLQGLACKLVKASNWSVGMSASIRVGIEALRHDADGIFLFLGDMPLVPVALCEELARLAEQSGYAARPLHGDLPGHPVAFARSAVPDLTRLSGDTGADRSSGDRAQKSPICQPMMKARYSTLIRLPISLAPSGCGNRVSLQT